MGRPIGALPWTESAWTESAQGSARRALLGQNGRLERELVEQRCSSWPRVAREGAAACLAVVIVLGSVLLWLGVPVGGAWLAAQVTSDGVSAVLFALLAIPVTMAGFAWVLYRVSARYEELRGGEPRRRSPPPWRESLGEERARVRRGKGGRPLIDVSMTVSAVLAALAISIWFFFFAERRLSPFP